MLDTHFSTRVLFYFNILLFGDNVVLNLTTDFGLYSSFFASRGIGMINASPIGMGLLTEKPPAWHPAPKATRLNHCYVKLVWKEKECIYLLNREAGFFSQGNIFLLLFFLGTPSSRQQLTPRAKGSLWVSSKTVFFCFRFQAFFNYILAKLAMKMCLHDTHYSVCLGSATNEEELVGRNNN